MKLKLTLLQKGLILISVPLLVESGILISLLILQAQAEHSSRQLLHKIEISETMSGLFRDLFDEVSRGRQNDTAEPASDSQWRLAKLGELVKDDRNDVAVVGLSRTAAIEAARTRARIRELNARYGPIGLGGSDSQAARQMRDMTESGTQAGAPTDLRPAQKLSAPPSQGNGLTIVPLPRSRRTASSGQPQERIRVIDLVPVPRGAARAGNPNAAIRAELTSLRQQLRQQLHKVVSPELVNLADRNASAELELQDQLALIKQTITALIYSAVLANVLMVIFCIQFCRDIFNRVGALSKNAESLVSNQPLLPKPQSLLPAIGGDDEIAALDGVVQWAADLVEEARKNQRATMDNAGDVICSIDREFKFLNVNLACCRVLGYAPEELQGTRITNLVFDQDRRQFAEGLADVIRTNNNAVVEARFVHKEGAILDMVCSPRWSREDRSLSCVIHNITERKALERLRQEILQMVSHDLRNPLLCMQAFLDYLDDEHRAENLGSMGEQLLQIAHRGANRMQTLVNDLLDIERLDSGMLQLVKLDISLSDVFLQSVQTVTPLATAKRVSINSPRTDLWVNADLDRLVQVMVNLLSNAIKFSPEDSWITITTKKEDSFLEVAVIDEGRGIPPQLLSSIFDRFRQVKHSDTKQQRGSGLGWRSVKR